MIERIIEYRSLCIEPEYDVISVEKDWYRIKDDSGEDYLYPPESFEVVEK